MVARGKQPKRAAMGMHRDTIAIEETGARHRKRLCGARWIISLGLLWMLSPACLHAAGLHKCRIANGGHLYASGGCPAGSRELWQREVAPDPAQEAAVQRRWKEIEAWQGASRREAADRARRPSGLARTSHQSAGKVMNPCERARQRRDRIRDRDWMRMTYDRMIRLDEEVADACR